ncbi:MAG: prepilin-type N-terminal cleavage/methylation domain-containing protein [Dehalococcoidia bacterium]|nr:prepilin-type N-terminal cleavage/methylation domain-containing protein [Dehalococcoidia bacterium]
MKNQKGFTLIELIVALAIASVIGVAATMTAHQVVTIPVISNDSNTAINQVRNAVNWINRDVQSATPGSINTTSSKFLSMEHLEWDDGTSTWSTPIRVEYALGNGELRRSYNESTPGTLVAQYIDTASCSWNSTEKVLTVNITVQVGTRTETRTFEVKPRPD